jgi:hypothetical protein
LTDDAGATLSGDDETRSVTVQLPAPLDNTVAPAGRMIETGNLVARRCEG